MMEKIEALPDDPLATDADREFILRAYQIAAGALSRGNRPFASLLVHERRVLLECENTVETSGDLTRHAETALISRGSPRHPAGVLSQSVLYTSTEPCIMCCGAIYWARIPRVVYGTEASQMSRLLERDSVSLPCREIFQRISPNLVVVGPILEEEGLRIHAEWKASRDFPSRL